MKLNRVTLIELMVIAFAVVMVACIWSVGVSSNSVSLGINGVVESRCVDGYKFMMSHDGSARQVMDEFGHGVRCR
jgi:hypothetical protein